MTNDSGLYIYCVMDQKEEVGIEREKIQTSNQSRFKFGNIGVRNQPIFKISHKDLTAVVSNFSLKQLKADIDDVVAHQKVVETMRKELERPYYLYDSEQSLKINRKLQTLFQDPIMNINQSSLSSVAKMNSE
jgi:Gas vesicle synthesis protein GvpL/GvpF